MLHVYLFVLVVGYATDSRYVVGREVMHLSMIMPHPLVGQGEDSGADPVIKSVYSGAR